MKDFWMEAISPSFNLMIARISTKRSFGMLMNSVNFTRNTKEKHQLERRASLRLISSQPLSKKEKTPDEST